MLYQSAFERMGAIPAERVSDSDARLLLLTQLFAAWSEQAADGVEIEAAAGTLATPGGAPGLTREVAAASAELARRDPRNPLDRARVLEMLTPLCEGALDSGNFVAAEALGAALVTHAPTTCAATVEAMHQWLRGKVRRGWHASASATAEVSAHLAAELAREDLRLRAQSVLAELHAKMGNFPRAELLIRRVHSDAIATGRPDLTAWASGRVGMHYNMRDDFHTAIPLLLAGITGPVDRQDQGVFMMGIGTSLMRLGHRAAARDALELALRMLRGAVFAAAIHLNLMRLAADRGDRAAFERWRLALLEGHPDESMLSALHCMAGEAYHLFGARGLARANFERAIALAEKHGTTQWIFLAEKGLAELDAGTPPCVPPEPRAAPEVAPAIAYVRELRAAMDETTR